MQVMFELINMFGSIGNYLIAFETNEQDGYKVDVIYTTFVSHDFIL